jgi:hypothetical protein
VGHEGRLAAEFASVGLGVGPIVRGALENAPPFELRRHAENGEDDLGEVGRGTKERARPVSGYRLVCLAA